MGRSQVFKGVELIKPDAYSAIDVSRLLTPTSAGVGIVALVGESEGGKPGLHIFPGGASPSVVKKELKSGPGANMVRLALRSGTDALVQAGASTVLFFKTNNSTQSELAVSGVGYKFKIKSKDYGAHTALYTASIATTGGSKYLTVKDEDGVAEVSVGVGSKNFFTIQRSNVGGCTAAQVKLSYVSGALKLEAQQDVGAGLVSAFNLDVTNMTLKQVKNQLSTYAGWSMIIGAVSDESMKMKDLDMVIAYQACFASAYGFKASVYELVQWGSSISQLVSIERGVENNVDGVPSSLAQTSLTGGTRGTTANSDVQSALNELLKLRVNILVPLFCKDSQDGSTITIDSVNAMVKDHVSNRSSILGRSECQAYVSKQCNKDDFKTFIADMNSRWIACSSHKIDDLDINGNLITHDEYAFSVVCAQTQAGSPIGTPLTNRVLPINGISQDVSWNPIENGNEMIKAGALIAGVDENNVIRIINGYTSWLADDNNANIFIETVESLAIFAFNHRQFMKQKFLGQSNFTRADVLKAIEQSCIAERDTTRSIKNFDLTQIKINSISAGRLEYDVAVVPFEGIVFVLPTVVAIREE